MLRWLQPLTDRQPGRPTWAALALLLAAAPALARPLVVCTEGSPEGFDITQYTAATTADATAETVYERLVQFAPGSTKVIPALAQSWDISADGLAYTFHPRPLKECGIGINDLYSLSLDIHDNYRKAEELIGLAGV